MGWHIAHCLNEEPVLINKAGRPCQQFEILGARLDSVANKFVFLPCQLFIGCPIISRMARMRGGVEWFGAWSVRSLATRSLAIRSLTIRRPAIFCRLFLWLIGRRRVFFHKTQDTGIGRVYARCSGVFLFLRGLRSKDGLPPHVEATEWEARRRGYGVIHACACYLLLSPA